MAKRGGFPGGGMPGNMANLMKQAQKMQRQMEESQKELEEKEFTAKAGGGAVEVTISGKKQVTSVKLKEEVVQLHLHTHRRLRPGDLRRGNEKTVPGDRPRRTRLDPHGTVQSAARVPT